MSDPNTTTETVKAIIQSIIQDIIVQYTPPVMTAYEVVHTGDDVIHLTDNVIHTSSS